MGGQSKMPRCRSDREVADSLQALATDPGTGFNPYRAHQNSRKLGSSLQVSLRQGNIYIKYTCPSSSRNTSWLNLRAPFTTNKIFNLF